MTKLYIAILLFIAIPPSYSSAFVDVADETEPGFWRSKVVVMAKVARVADPAAGIQRLSLEVMAVLFADVLTPVQLEVQYRGAVADSATSNITLKDGDIAIFFLVRDKNGEWRVPNAVMHLFDTKCGIQPNDGKLDGTQFNNWLARIEKARRESIRREVEAVTKAARP